jgi:hypothetical protein
VEDEIFWEVNGASREITLGVRNEGNMTRVYWRIGAQQLWKEQENIVDCDNCGTRLRRDLDGGPWHGRASGPTMKRSFSLDVNFITVTAGHVTHGPSMAAVHTAVSTVARTST